MKAWPGLSCAAHCLYGLLKRGWCLLVKNFKKDFEFFHCSIGNRCVCFLFFPAQNFPNSGNCFVFSNVNSNPHVCWLSGSPMSSIAQLWLLSSVSDTPALLPTAPLELLNPACHTQGSQSSRETADTDSLISGWSWKSEEQGKSLLDLLCYLVHSV